MQTLDTELDTSQTFDYAHELISSARVEGTPVFDPVGEKLGTIHSVMIHKRSGQVAYVLLSFGGILGVGRHVYPIPWERLTYHEDRHGYVVEISRQQLESAPKLDLDSDARPREAETSMYTHWDTTPYW
jgi:hypothetical protein